MDSNYISTYHHTLTARYYFSRKYTNIGIINRDKIRFTYKPNSTLNTGFGASYKHITLNIAYGFSFLNPHTERGKTTYLDLQAHNYKPQRSIDFYGQFYKGFYLAPIQIVNAKNPILLKPNMEVMIVGLNYNHIYNSKQFSYAAAFNQTEWQKKSAGSPMLGVESYFTYFNDEDGLIPTKLDKIFDSKMPKDYYNFKIGPTAGYAHTFVLKEHLFATAAATAGLDINFSKEENMPTFLVDNFIYSIEKINLKPSVHARLAIGYNSEKYNVCLSWVNFSSYSNGFTNDLKYKTNIGNYRLQFAKRFNAPKLLKRIYKEVL